jgi:hypothetical protein
MLVNDVKWFIWSCHKCQVHQTQHFHIPLTIPIIGGLFRKVHINMMLMSHSGGYWYIVQTRCVLTAYPEWRMLHSENFTTLPPSSLKTSFTGGVPSLKLLLTAAPLVSKHYTSSQTDTVSTISVSPPIILRLMVWSKGVITRCGRPSSKVPMGGSLAGTPSLTWYFWLSASQ